MQAIQLISPGPPRDALRRVEIPDPVISRPGEIRVRIKAAGVNPIDTKLRSRGVFYPDAYPAILGCDGAGIVTDCGSAVQRFRPGDEVWFCHGGLGATAGNYAQFTVLDEQYAQPKPVTADFAAAAALPLVAITAWEALFDRAGLKAGQTVLVHAGAGGVGHVAVQLAHAAGARVATTVSNADKATLARELGAERIIHYRDEDVAASVLDWTGGRGADVVFDTLGGQVFQDSLTLARVYGQVVTLLEPPAGTDWKPARNRNLSVSFTLMLTPMMQDLPEAAAHQGEILRECAAMVDRGELRPVVSASLPLSAAAEAHERIEQGHTTGKIVLLPPD